MKKIKQLLKRILLITTSLVILYFFLPSYLQNTIKHLFPGIYDYEFFDNNEVVNHGTKIPWEEAITYNQDSLAQKYADYHNKMRTVGYLVIQDNKIVHESYWNKSDKEKLSGSFSAAKSIVAMLIGCAIDDGYIESVNDRIGQYLEPYNRGETAVITIRDLLNMSSGLSWDESYANPISVTTEAYYGDDLWSLVNNLKLVEPSGTEFKYLSGDTQLLGFVVKKATGKSLASYCSEKLWSKMGATQTAFWSTDIEGGMEKAYCCFNASLRDYARFGKLILNKGNFDGEQLISESYMAEMQSPATHLDNPKFNKPVDFYGFQLWIMNHKGMQIPYMRGIGGQYIFAIPSKNAVVVRLGHKRDKEKEYMHTKDAYRYIDMALEVLN